MADELKYEDLKFPTFENSHVVMSVDSYNPKGEKHKVDIPVSDVVRAVVLMGGSLLNIGPTRCGKTQLMRDICDHWFGGEIETEKGKSHWDTAKNDYSADAWFRTIDQSKVGDGRGMLSDSKVFIEARLKCLCNVMDEINLAIPEIQVEYFGLAEGQHKGKTLGDNEYYLFMSSCNLNRVDGDYAGTSQMNIALLNRFTVTLDFDNYVLEDFDRDKLAEKDIPGRPKRAPLRDISDKILQANAHIRETASQRDPWLDLYFRLFESGLDYCAKNSEKRKKRAWPQKCGGCDYVHKDLCSLVKQSHTGTTAALKRFAKSIDYLIHLRDGEIQFDPFSLALESFRLTTYHGNLNAVETSSTYAGEDQEHMNVVVKMVKEKVDPIKTYLDLAVEEATKGRYITSFILVKNKKDDKKPYIFADSPKIIEQLKGEKLSFKLISPFQDSFGEDNGIRIDWVPGYLKSLAKAHGYQEH